MSKEVSKIFVRPISPHLGIYRPQISSVMSILHRITGVALFAGTALLVTWLWSAAYVPSFYATLYGLATTLPGRLCLMGWTAAFYYHLCNGIRHLFWDMGKGFELPTMHLTGWLTLLATLVFTALTWGVALSVSAGGQ